MRSGVCSLSNDASARARARQFSSNAPLPKSKLDFTLRVTTLPAAVTTLTVVVYDSLVRRIDSIYFISSYCTYTLVILLPSKMPSFYFYVKSLGLTFIRRAASAMIICCS